MLYSLGIYLYHIILHIASVFHPKAKAWIKGRKNFWSQLPQIENQNVVWFHCASLGEYDQGKPVMEKWKETYPNDFLLITFFSPSGYEHIVNKSIGDYTCYLPLDTKKNAQKFIQHFQPKNTFFVKYEFWINFLKATKQGGSKIYAISASFRKKQHFFKWYGGIFRKALGLFDHIFVQNQKSLDLLSSINIRNASISGDTRYDRVMQRAAVRNENVIIAPWAKDEEIFIIGSSWPDDEEIIIPYINDFKIKSKVIIAPHEVHSKNIERITQSLKVSYQLYTQIEKGEPLNPLTMVLVLDCIGVLADVYQYGKIAYVGGGFGTGLHNILEPASFGLPVIFGPKHQKFPEAHEFIERKIGKSCHENRTFFNAYREFIKEENINERVSTFMNEKKGATEIIISKVIPSKKG